MNDGNFGYEMWDDTGIFFSYRSWQIVGGWLCEVFTKSEVRLRPNVSCVRCHRSLPMWRIVCAEKSSMPPFCRKPMEQRWIIFAAAAMACQVKIDGRVLTIVGHFAPTATIWSYCLSVCLAALAAFCTVCCETSSYSLCRRSRERERQYVTGGGIVGIWQLVLRGNW